MDFAFSEEQEALREVARRYLAEAHPVERLADVVASEPGWDPAAWKGAADLGWLDAELGMLEHAVLFEETAAGLLPAPLFSTLALALPAIERDEALRAAVAVGERRLTLAWAEPGRSQSLLDAVACDTAADGSGRVSGHKILVPDVASVDSFVVVCRDSGGGPQLRVVAVDDVEVRRRATLDATRGLGDVVLDCTPSQLIARGEEAVDVLRSTRRRALAAAACEAVGVASRALRHATEHATTREQFGRVIGSYQGVSHRVADSYVRLELARSLTCWAAWCVAEGDPQVDLACAAAKSDAAAAAVLVCENAIQVLGGVGFTWEHPLHRYYKRAQWLDAFDGHGREHRAAVAAALLDGSADDAGRPAWA